MLRSFTAALLMVLSTASAFAAEPPYIEEARVLKSVYLCDNGAVVTFTTTPKMYVQTLNYIHKNHTVPMGFVSFTTAQDYYAGSVYASAQFNGIYEPTFGPEIAKIQVAPTVKALQLVVTPVSGAKLTCVSQ